MPDGASLMVQQVKNSSAMQETQETWVQSLGQEDPLEEGMVPTPVFLLGKSHGERRRAGYGPWDCKESDMTEVTSTSQSTYARYYAKYFANILFLNLHDIL